MGCAAGGQIKGRVIVGMHSQNVFFLPCINTWPVHLQFGHENRVWYWGGGQGKHTGLDLENSDFVNWYILSSWC